MYGAAASASSGAALWYSSDEPTRRKIESVPRSALRVGRLAGTVAMIAAEYKIVAPFNSIAESGFGFGETSKLKEVRIELRERQDEEEKLGRNLIFLMHDGASKNELEVARNALAVSHQQVCDSSDRLVDLEENSNEKDSWIHTHETCANLLLELCKLNAGVYVKLGQHVSQLDHMLPPAYITILRPLLEDAPRSSYEAVEQVIFEDLGKKPSEIWDNFEVEPIASASLGQVHVAKDKETGKKLAVKVQHRGLLEYVDGDIASVEVAMKVTCALFPDFGQRFAWLVEEVLPVVRKELDFRIEARNCMISRQQFSDDPQVIVPEVHTNESSSRILTMSFEDGCTAVDRKYMEEHGLSLAEVSALIAKVFSRMVFEHGFVHCDPHPANIRVIASPRGAHSWLRPWHRSPRVVLLDHGQYRELDDHFRLSYAKLWQAMIFGDKPGIEEYCVKLGAPADAFPLLAAMITNRPFAEISNDVDDGLRGLSPNRQSSKGDQARIRLYAEKYAFKIAEMLDHVSRKMILVFKMNDSVRFIDRSLGSPVNTFIVAGEVSANSLYKEAIKDRRIGALGWFGFLFAYCRFVIARSRLFMATVLLSYHAT